MPLVADRSMLSVGVSWLFNKLNTGFSSTEQIDQVTSTSAPSATTYNHLFGAQYTIAAAGTQAVDFYGPWTNFCGESVTATKVVAVRVTVTGNSTLKIAPHGTNPLSWPFKGTAPYIDLVATTAQPALWLHADGTHFVLSATIRSWLLTNTGAASLTVNVVAYCGT